ncbi:MAG: hypothetical protein AAF677_00860 [Pseudomonadota bacterium]
MTPPEGGGVPGIGGEGLGPVPNEMPPAEGVTGGERPQAGWFQIVDFLPRTREVLANRRRTAAGGAPVDPEPRAEGGDRRLASDGTAPPEISEDFLIQPREGAGPIPPIALALHVDIVRTWNRLKMLRNRGIIADTIDDEAERAASWTSPLQRIGRWFAALAGDERTPLLVRSDEDTTFFEFRRRLLSTARAGLVGAEARPEAATQWLRVIRNDLAHRVGRRLKLRYLGRLALSGAWVACFGAALAVVAVAAPGLSGYGIAILGSVIGCWMAVAASRRKVVFEDLIDYVDVGAEPRVRMVFVAFVAVALCVLFGADVMAVNLGGVELKDFQTDQRIALILGLLAGIAERQVSLRIIEQVEGSAKG